MSNNEVREKYNALLQAVSVSEDIKRDHIRIQRTYGHNNAMLGWSHEPFVDAIAAVKQVCPKISDKTIATEISRSIVSLFEKHIVREDADPDVDAQMETILPVLEEKAIEEKLNQLIAFLENQVQTYTILIPIDGVELTDDELELGDTIFHRTKKDKLLSEISSLSIEDDIKNELKEPFIESGCYVAIKSEGDFDHACQVALDKAQLAIDILNLFLTSCHSRIYGYAKICLSGHPIQRSRSILGRTYELSDGQLLPTFSSEEILAPGRKFKVGKSAIDTWRNSGLEKILEYCAIENIKPNTMPSRIQHAITWYSKGVNADNTDEQFLNLAISLESLLVGSEGDDPAVSWGSITQKLSERVAFLLGTDCDSRIKIAKDVKELYGIRSKIVHQGRPTSLENLFHMNYIVENSILAFIQHQCSSWPDFLSWIERQKFTLGNQAAT